MRFSITAVLALAASLVQAGDPTPGFHPITKPTQGEEVPAGSTYEIVWEPSATYPGTVTIGLLGGSSPSTLDIVDTIAKGVDGSAGSYSWAVPATLGDKATYGIKVSLDSDTTIFQYGFPFKIVGGGSSSSSSTTGSATGSASVSETATETSATATTKSASSTGSASGSITSAVSSTITLSSSTLTSSTIRGNLSTTAHSTITSFTVVTPSTTTRSATSTIATNGVASLAAGSFAMLGGVAMAVFAL